MPADSQKRRLCAIVICLLLFPFLVFVFSRFVTGAFNERCATVAIVGSSLLAAWLARDNRLLRQVLPVLLLAAAALAFRQSAPPVQIPLAAFWTTGSWLSGGDRKWENFFNLEERVNPELSARLFYLTHAPEVPFEDTTNQHQVERWKTIRPDLPVFDLVTFVRSHPYFYVLQTKTSDDTRLKELLRSGEARPFAKVQNTTISASRTLFPLLAK